MTLRVPAAVSRREIRVLGSRFIAEAAPVGDEDAARSARRSFLDEFPDATHHCWALSLSTSLGERVLVDDAGEPAGTAGAPILQAIRGAGVTNALVVVARYFGGVKLGKGGLARAYRDAAKAAITSAGVSEAVPTVRLRLAGPAGADGEVRHFVARHAGRVTDASYSDSGVVVLLVEAPDAAADLLIDDVARVTRGAWVAGRVQHPRRRG
jgi:putative IMPACT (imprinted ancient) family translation regulator